MRRHLWMTRVRAEALDEWGAAVNDHRRNGKAQAAQIAHRHVRQPLRPHPYGSEPDATRPCAPITSPKSLSHDASSRSRRRGRSRALSDRPDHRSRAGCLVREAAAHLSDDSRDGQVLADDGMAWPAPNELLGVSHDAAIFDMRRPRHARRHEHLSSRATIRWSSTRRPKASANRPGEGVAVLWERLHRFVPSLSVSSARPSRIRVAMRHVS